MRFTLQKRGPSPTLRKSEDDTLRTPQEMKVMKQYAVALVDRGVRLLNLEREYPDLRGLFYDFRTDPDLAREYAS